MRDTRNTSITHRDLAHDRCEKSSRGIWQRGPHSNRYAQGRVAVNRYAQGRVAVRFTLPLGIERTDAVRSGSSGSQPVRSGPSGSALHTATRYRTYRCGTLRVEWQCNRYAQGRVAVHFTLPLDGERTGPVRSGSSGSVGRDGTKSVSATSASGCALSEAGPSLTRSDPSARGNLFATGLMQLGGCNWVAFLQAGWSPFLQTGRSPGRSG